MTKLIVFISVAALVLIVGCGGGSDQGVEVPVESQIVEVVKEVPVVRDVLKEVVLDNSVSAMSIGAPLAPAIMATPAPVVVRLEAEGSRPAGDFSSSASSLDTTQRKVISSASVSIEVEVVESAITKVRVVAEGLAS